jgi:hypothetical protein
LAAKIIEVKSNQAKVEPEGEVFQVGDKLWAADDFGKILALLVVKNIEGNSIQTQVLKGIAKQNLVVGKMGTKPPKKENNFARSVIKENAKWAGMIGLGSNSMTVKPSSSASATLNGTSIDVSAMYFKKMDSTLGLRLTGKYHSLKVSGRSNSISACSNTDCYVDLNFIGTEILGTYTYSQGNSHELWLGTGLGLFLAVNKDSNVLDTFKISISETLLLSTGMDWKIDKTTFIPIQLDYALYPDNQTSSANQFIVSLGYGKAF